jgi:hypothetical protein
VGDASVWKNPNNNHSYSMANKLLDLENIANIKPLKCKGPTFVVRQDVTNIFNI